jgi:SAM-dependent methyltransferase
LNLNLVELNEIVACPNCKAAIELQESGNTRCSGCGESYRKLSFSWELIPSSLRSFELLDVWEQLQKNGLVSYQEDPEHNLSVGERGDCRAFAQFCQYTGRVLDIGCGIQPWPSYFSSANGDIRFIGIDPLVGESPADYVQIRSVGEFLPFAENTFDRILYATSLDHVIDPIQSLREANRVAKEDGEIDLWIGEKSPSTPKPTESPDWYEGLVKPDGADDAFHYRRLDSDIVKTFVAEAGLRIVAEECVEIDQYRRRYFLRLMG